MRVATVCTGIGDDEITMQMVKDKLYYKDGRLYWRVKPSNSVNIGDLAGSIVKGRLRTKIYGKCFYNSRLTFLYHYGYIPKVVDHKDRNPLNNKIENLRGTDQMHNSKNRSASKTSKSKFLGVHLLVTTKKLKNNIDKTYKYWAASIRVNKKLIHLGTFPNNEIGELNAAKAYNKAAIEYHGEFSNLNKI